MLQDVLNDMIRLAENLYGNKVGKYQVKISEIKKGNIQPHIGIMYDGSVEIFITDNAYNQLINGDKINAYNQIGHEVIHSLMQPQENGNSNYLEEGLAVYFSVIILLYYKLIEEEEINRIINNFKEYNYKYYQAFMLIHDSKINEDIKNIRIKKPFLAQVKYDDLNNLSIDENIKKLLLKNFKEEIDF